MEKMQKKERKSNIELLRIFAIFAIIISHFNIHSNFTPENPVAFNFNYYLSILGQVGVISNIIFMIISGYFLVKTNPKPKKILKLIFKMYFYSILIFIGIKFFTNEPITINALKETFLPFPFGNWYCTMYIIIYLLSPYLNKLISVLKKDEFKKLLIIAAVLFSLVPFFTTWNTLSRLSIFFLGYLIGAYIQLYAKESYGKKYILKRLVASILATFIAVSGFYLLAVVLNKAIFLHGATYILVANCSPFVILIAICIFLFFRELNVKQNKIINCTAASTLGIYLIHENIFLRPIIWQKIAIVDINAVSPIQFIVFAIIKCLAVFSICLVIDQARLLIASKIFKREKHDS